ncbi:MAG: carbohydrate ABC transporter permease [Candidatus Gastranaerophilaceae bacterium]
MYKFYGKSVPYLFLLPAAVVLFVFFFIPFFYTVTLSFFDYSSNLYNPSFAGFDNYIYLFKSKEFFSVILNTLLYLIVAVPILTVLPLIPAVLLSEKIRFANLYKLLIYLPVIVSIVVVAIAFKQIYAGNGILNWFLSLFGVAGKDWLTSPDYALISVAFVTVYKGIGYYMMIYLAALTGMPRELLDAARTDGANALQTHLNVTVPYLMPTIAFVVTMSSISALKVFTEIYVMTHGGPLNSSETVVYYIYEKAFENLDLSLASAASVVLLVIVSIFSLLNIFVFEKKRYEP